MSENEIKSSESSAAACDQTGDRRNQNELGQFDVAVIGGGIAGSVAAIRLARAGLNVAVFEKSQTSSHKVCGEFLSGEGVAQLEELGIELGNLGAVPIHKFRLHGPHLSGTTKLPTSALGLSRKVLDEKLLNCAEFAGAKIFRSCLVQNLVENSMQNQKPFATVGARLLRRLPFQAGGLHLPQKIRFLDQGEARENQAGTKQKQVMPLARFQFAPTSDTHPYVVQTSDGTATACRVILASGKTEFKPLPRHTKKTADFVGFKMHLQLKPSAAKRLQGHCDLFIFKHGYGGLSPIEDGKANLCFLLEKSFVKKIGVSWENLASHIAQNNRQASRYLDGAVPLFKNFVSVTNLPYGFIRATRTLAGLFCVGDQMAVISSLTGDGMSIALLTGREAAQSILHDVSTGQMPSRRVAAMYQKKMRRTLQSQIKVGIGIQSLFRSPSLCDLAALTIEQFPVLFKHIFAKTRCPGSERVRSTSEPAPETGAAPVKPT